ncbi:MULTISPECIES: electron transfer flavoprotein subunit beta/FixA family protein [unclassified Streptomyces]|uniref:electron transfer flavoprotein subunit beta/FixA family protein n=1 Tax=unclassified Streptomyces TaxID=2593676 RepID=UPI002475EC6F|nr:MULTISPECIES: electron transfer flavoprotein subunit beta/FixA family protein [unclassified Streptomyces]MDH6455243.1 electron transfer flavoprotein beta subunit [Streptomyces sp. SAI-119]MDH6494204.1 electron transfer flavoprotein beta subunit [Streptomyces sp. SAI-149]
MNIVVLVKQVPDTAAARTLSETDHSLDRANTDLVLDEINERAAEEALTLKETTDAEVTVVSMGPDSALDAIRKVLAMGADRGIHIRDDRLQGADVVSTAKVLAAAVRTVADVDLVLAGNATTDGQASAVPAVVADLLGLPQLTHVRALALDAGRVRAERETESGRVTLEAPLPALVSVTEKINEPRYPSFKGIMAAKKKPVVTIGLDDLFPDADDTGFLVTRTRVLEAVPRPARVAGVRVTDDGSAGRQLAAHLIARKLL